MPWVEPLMNARLPVSSNSMTTPIACLVKSCKASGLSCSVKSAILNGMTDGDRADGLTGETLATWASLATLLEWLPPALDAPLLRDAGLTHFEYGILYALADAPDSTLRMSELAAYANSSLTRLSRAIARLEKRGWVLRRPDPTDGRYTLAVL